MGDVQHHPAVSTESPEKSVDVVDGQLFEKARVLASFHNIVPQNVHNASLFTGVQKRKLVLRIRTASTFTSFTLMVGCDFSQADARLIGVLAIV